MPAIGSLNNRVNTTMAKRKQQDRGQNIGRRGPGRRVLQAEGFRVADEVRYIQRQAADGRSCIVIVGQLVLFSTNSGDAWLLDPSDMLAARRARNGETEPIRIEETDTTFGMDWPGRYRIEGPAFVYEDRRSGRVVTILGYPTDQLMERISSLRAAGPSVPLT